MTQQKTQEKEIDIWHILANPDYFPPEMKARWEKATAAAAEAEAKKNAKS